jgi:hypothetical protein
VSDISVGRQHHADGDGITPQACFTVPTGSPVITVALMPVDRDGDPVRRADLAARGARLRLDAATVDVSAALEAASVEALLLKGATTVDWLYRNADQRTYLDCDLLVAPEQRQRAERVLEQCGYHRHFDDRRMPPWWREHAGEWVRADGVTVDLHRRLPGVGVAAERAWLILSRDTTTVSLQGQRVPALSLPARALHVALHAAHHGVDVAGPLHDLERALVLGDDELWSAAMALAQELAATDAFAAGLRLSLTGAELADRLGLAAGGSVRVRLLAASPPPVALGFAQLAETRGLWARTTIVARKLAPPPDFIRHWDPRAAQSRSNLLRAYLRRPIWLLARAPAGFRAWQRARRID